MITLLVLLPVDAREGIVNCENPREGIVGRKGMHIVYLLCSTIVLHNLLHLFGGTE